MTPWRRLFAALIHSRVRVSPAAESRMRMIRLAARRIAAMSAPGLLLTVAVLAGSPSALAINVTRSLLQRHVGADREVGEQNARLPVWPVYRTEPTGPVLDSWLFVSSDIEKIRGYAGKPIDLLISLTPSGEFQSVDVLAHHEPIFRSPLGNRQLGEFASQYEGLSIDYATVIGSPDDPGKRSAMTARLHGISHGTVSAVAIDRTIMTTATRVAQARLGDASAPAVVTLPPAADEVFQRSDWAGLESAGLVKTVRVSNIEVEESYEGTPAVGLDAPGRRRPNESGIELSMLPAGLPQVGRNLFDVGGWVYVHEQRERGVQPFVVFDAGRYRVPLAGSPRSPLFADLRLRQDGVDHELLPLPFPFTVRLDDLHDSGVPSHAGIRMLGTTPGSPFDIARPFEIVVRAGRSPGDGNVHLGKASVRPFTIAGIEQWLPRRELPAWLKVWLQRRGDIAVLVGGLLVMSIALFAQRRITRDTRRFDIFRIAFLLFTLCFIGWYAQGQLTIVNLTSIAQSLVAGDGVAFMLADPMAVVMWLFVLVTLVIWGRGTFCGWLCPFGAFQELVSRLGQAFGVDARNLHTRIDARLKWVKYVVLAAIASLTLAPGMANDLAVEIEPFKTAISMGFDRPWPYVLWAIVCLGTTLVVYRGFCRYLCPLGAMLAIVGRLRRWAWIPRRDECGTPCQTCRFRCRYQAIEPGGDIDYAECFQCLDCVAIEQDDKRCMPRILVRKRAVTAQSTARPIEFHR